MNRLFIVLCLLSFSCHAKEAGLVRVYCEPQFGAVHDFILDLDDQDNIACLIRRSDESQTTFSTAQLQESDVSIANTKGKDVILIHCPDYNQEIGGFFVLKFLHNGLTNQYQALYMSLEKTDQGWELFTPPPHRQKIQTLRIVPRKIAGVLIGVKHVEVNK